MKGAEILIKTLIEENVDTVFGYPGSSVLEIYDALYKHPEIRHILTSHEQGAVHAADGYARSSGRVGVCIATSGPGATNLVTGIATAYMDSVPIVAITGNVSTKLLGKDSFQEVDIFGITMPITKQNFIVKDVKYLKETVKRAFEIAKSGRPGPVLIDITTDAISAECDTEHFVLNSQKKAHVFSEEDIKNAAKLINASKKPLIYVGGGAVISGAYKEVRALADVLNAPVIDSLMGKGVFPGNDKKYLGMLGIFGTEEARKAVFDSDLLIAIGVRFSDRAMHGLSEILKEKKIIHIDVDYAEINKNAHSDVSIVGDAKKALSVLLTEIKHKERKLWRTGAEKRDSQNSDFAEENVVRTINKKLNENTIVVTEVGRHQMTAVSNYCFMNPRTLITSGGLGTMGYGMGAAIGAKLANPDKTVIDIAGDGCFRMNMNEILTAVRYKTPIIVFVMNNHSLGLVRDLQDEYCDGRHSCTDLEDTVDYVLLAESMHAKGFKVTNETELENAIAEALKSDVPVIIDCEVTKK